MKKLRSLLRSIALGVVMALTLMVVGCGGGGGSSGSATASPVASALPPGFVYRTDLLVGYYGEFGSQVEETSDHVNLMWIWGWEVIPGEDTATHRLKEMDARGIPNAIIGLWESFEPNAEVLIRARLDSWKAQGLLGLVYGFTPVDEPDGAGMRSADELRVWAAMMRRVMADYPELGGKKLAVIYSPAGRPAIDVFDLAGWDDYNHGAGVLGAPLTEFEALLRPDQGVILIPGGADGLGSGSREDPSPFFIKAQTDLHVKAIVSFLWFDHWDAQPMGGAGGDAGIRSNGMREAYCLMGKKIVNPLQQNPTC